MKIRNITKAAVVRNLTGAALGLDYTYNADPHLSQTVIGRAFGGGLDRLSLQGDLTKRFPMAGLTRYSVGIGHAVSPSFTVKLDAARVVSVSDRDSVLGLNLEYQIGGGATFGQRDYPHLLPGF